MRPLKVGIGLPDMDLTMSGVTPRWRDILAIARTAEDVGFDSVWVEDHFMYRFDDPEAEAAEEVAMPTEGTVGPWESFSILAAVAATTQRVELGTLVTCTGFRSPALTAKIAATIDEISDGRMILGLGSGYHEPEFRAQGVPFGNKIGRFEEAIQIIRALLREGEVDFEGKYYSARECVLDPRGPRPNGLPIMFGGQGPRLLEIAGKYADRQNSFFPFFDNAPSGIPALRATVDAGCEAVGRDPATLERSVALLVDVESKGDVPELLSMGMKPLPGSPAALAESLRAFAAEGISHVQIHPWPTTAAAVEALAPALEALDRG